MARPLRIEFEGALYHVMSRGNDRRAVVRDDADRGRWLEWLGAEKGISPIKQEVTSSTRCQWAFEALAAGRLNGTRCQDEL